MSLHLHSWDGRRQWPTKCNTKSEGQHAPAGLGQQDSQGLTKPALLHNTWQPTLWSGKPGRLCGKLGLTGLHRNC